jgi:Ca2+-binding RTX toxin-like protein
MLTQSERQQIENALAQARASAANIEDRIYADAYDTVRQIFESKPGVDPYSITWLEGAAQVNRGEGFYSDFIREYTRRQVKTRRDEDISDSDLQKASNEIAEAVINDVLSTGSLPNIDQIALRDANGVASIFGDDLAIWSGNILFLLLNHDQSFNQNLIGVEGETYDVLAGFEIATDIGGSNFLGAISQVFDLSLTPFFALDAQERARLFLERAYGDDFSFTFDSLLGNVVLGTKVSDDALIGTGAILLGEIIHAGEGDDTIIGNGSTRDIIDGGKGRDIVDYSGISSLLGLTIDLGKQEKGQGLTTEFTGFVDGGGILDQDTLFNIEEIISTPKNDEFIIRDLNGSIIAIDAGESDDDLDHLNLRFSSSKIIYDNGQLSPGSVNNTSSRITVKNFEKISFGDEADTYNEFIQTGIKEVYLGGGDDTALFANPGTQLYGGPGSDTFWAVDKVLLADADADDQITFGDFRLLGGSRNADSESPYAIGQGGILYGLNQVGELIIENAFTGWQTFVAGAQVGPDTPGPQRTAGITLFEFAADAYRLLDLPSGIGREDWLDAWFDWLDLFLKTITGQDRRGIDPLILDLDGDGVELSALSSVSAVFDLDLDGFAEPTGWAVGGDGFLVLDKNNNGSIEDISELFGSPTQSGFDELKAYDLNDDDIIDSQDTVFADLNIWIDANNDGVTDLGELQTLEALEISHLSLQANPQDREQVGHYIAAESTFTRTDGTTNTISDVRFSIDNFNSVYLGDSTVDAAVTSLPNVKGKGTLTDLHIAMTQREAVKVAVEATLPTLTSIDLATLRDAILPILTAWGGPDLQTSPDVPILVQENLDGTSSLLDFAVLEGNLWRTASGDELLDSAGMAVTSVSLSDLLAQPVDPNTEWRILDGTTIGFLEKYLGEPLPLSQVEPGNRAAVNAVERFLELITERLSGLAVRLAAQGPLAPFFAGLTYDVTEDLFKPTSDRQLIPMFEAIFAAAKQQGDPVSYIERWQPTVSTVLSDFDRGADYLLISKAYIFANIVAAYESVGLTEDIRDIAAAFTIPPEDVITGSGSLAGSAGPDIFYMNAGDQIARGGEGLDVYVFGTNFGQDVIEDQEPPLVHSDDMIRFADIKSTDITAVREGLDLIITVDATGDSVRVKQQFDGETPSLFGGDLSEDYGVTEIIFADGIVWTLLDIAQAVSRPAASSDNIIGTPTIDFLDGGAGDDFLTGGDDSDTYRFGRGYGSDTIHEALENILVGGPDYVTFKEGITLSDIVFDRLDDSHDLIVKILDASDQLTVQGQFDAAYTGPFGKQWFDRIELFTFSDGTFIDWEGIQKKIIEDKETDSEDIIYGFDTEDILDGGAGNDFLSAGNENDTYLFGRGYGEDTILEGMDNILGGSQDTVRFLQGVTPESVSFSRNGDSDDLIVTLDDGSRLTIQEQFDVAYTGPFGKRWFNRIENFEFEDGTVITPDDIVQTLLRTGTPGDDIIYGFALNDTLDGGAGNDRLEGFYEGDTYIFGPGYGQDTIFDQEFPLENGDIVDKVIFQEGINPDDIRVERDNTDYNLVLAVQGTTDRLILEKQVNYSVIGPISTDIEEFHFDNGTVWSSLDIRNLYLSQATTDGDDTILGFFSNDTIIGGLGNDTLQGGDGSDTYFFDVGDGQDVITESVRFVTFESQDRIVFGAGFDPEDIEVGRSDSDLILASRISTDQLTITDFFSRLDYFQVEFFEFADGTVWTVEDINNLYLQNAGTDGNDSIEGTYADDIVDPQKGNDSITDPGGSDTYIFQQGYGQDVIYDSISTILDPSDDRVLFGPQILPAEVTFRKSSSDDLILEFDRTTDRLTITDYFREIGYFVVESLEFTDGTTWSPEQLSDWIASGLERIDSERKIFATDFNVVNKHIQLGITEFAFALENRGSSPLTDLEIQVIYSDDGIIGNSDDLTVVSQNIPDILIGSNPTKSLTVQLPIDLLNSRAQADDAPNLGANYVSNNVDYIGLTINGGEVLAIDAITYFPWDIDANGKVTPSDAIFVINRLGQTTTSENALADFDGSGQITPSDAIEVINRLGYSINPTVIETLA